MPAVEVKRLLVTLAAIAGVPLLMTSCGAEPTREVEASPTATASEPAGELMPCDPGSGFPVHKVGCPDLEPETGWLAARDHRLTLRPFRTLGNDEEGEAYARDHGEEYPFPNDYFDAPHGARHPLELTPGTVCTGIIRVGYREPLEDHVVSCDELVKVADERRLPVAVWLSGEEVVQVSELYRP